MCRSTVATPVSALEQVTVRAARRVRKVILAVDVTREARGARGVGCVPMPAVTVRAVVMLGLFVQARESRERVAARARGHRSNAIWPVRPVTSSATGSQFAVWRGRLRHVTRRALHARGRTGMRLVAIHADLVARGRRGKFSNVTGFARGRDTAGVRLVATSARLVPDARVAASVNVTRDTCSAASTRLVWQPLMTTLARGVTDARGRQRKLLLMTIRADGVLRRSKLELVRSVAALTRHASVEIMLGRGNAMTAAASSRHSMLLGMRRMRIVAAHARPVGNAFRMVGVDVRMAPRACGARVTANIVRSVATSADRMRGHASRRQHDDVRVAGATVHRALCVEFVGPMTADTLAVTSAEQCCRRHDRLSLAVAFGARSEGIGGGRVLMRVTSRAHAVWGRAERGVRRMDGRVAARAVSGDRFLVLVRAVTVQARGRGVHGNGRDLALGLVVAARTISRAVRFERTAIARIRLAVVARERMAIHAIRVHAGAEALLRQATRVLDRGARRMARRTTSRRNRAYRSGVQLMTQLMALIARDVLIDHVHAVPSHAAIGPPIQLDVHAFARRSCSALVSPLRGTADDCGKQEHADEQSDGEPNEAAQDSRMIRISNPTCDCGI